MWCRRPGFDSWVGKIPWKRKWQPTPVVLPVESQGQRSLAGYSPWGRNESAMTEQLSLSFSTKKDILFIIIVVVQVLSHASLFSVPWTAASHASLSFTTSQSLLKLVSIELRIPSSHLVLYHPLLLLPSIFSSNTVFSNESALHIRWPKYWSFSISPSNEYSEFISLGLTGLIYLLSIGERKKVRKLSFLSFFFPSP